MGVRKRRTKTNYNRIVDVEWGKIFDKYNVLKEVNKTGYFNITSKQINEFKEARLMTKFDFEDNLPDLFYDNDLSILPITRGSYIIGKFNAYEPLKYNNKIETKKVSFPSWIQSIDYKNLYSESAVLNCANVTNILQDVLGEELVQTISGRMSSSSFEFKIKSIDNNYKEIKINNSQCEIDGGYESINKLMIVEAKNSITKDFLIRQLYYPYRLWEKKIKKVIVPVFLTYSNDIYSFFIYKFKDPNIYNSLELVEQKNYIIQEDEIELNDILNILYNVKFVEEPKIPFPQADTFERVIDLLGILVEIDEISIDDISLNYAFNKRQAQYYSRAAMYLGLAENVNRGTVQLSKLGRSIMSKRGKHKNLSIAKCILSHKTFNDVMRKYIEKYEPLTKEEVSKIMQSNNLFGIDSINTYERRAQTVRAWVDLILDLQR
ncbi:MAG: translation elongation factor [Tissierellia bacterium]|nr:translation elongation factor [Tissierellia bacterium]